MKKQWGRWEVDTEASTLVYNSGREIRIFTVPPDETLQPSKVLAWIIGAYPSGRPTGDEIKDLTRAVEYLLDMAGLTDAPPGLGVLMGPRHDHGRDHPQRSGLL